MILPPEAQPLLLALAPAIADAALAAATFVPPFSFGRMTWIKPSFLWLMHRSRWGHKPGQERVLAVRLTRAGWETALALAVPTAYDPAVFRSPADWRAAFRDAKVHVQWDPERSLRGAGLPYGSIQVGLSRHVITTYAEEWVVGLEDLTPRVKKMYALLQAGQADKARRHLPPEKVYPVPDALRERLGMGP